MKIHLFITGFRNGTLDLDKKLPNLIKTYPNGKIEKTTQFNFPCIKGTNIVQNINVVKLSGKKVDAKINVDFYGFSHTCLSYFDISFDIELSSAEIIIQNFQKALLIEDTQVMIDGKPRAFGILITQYVLPYYDMSNYINISKSLDDDISSLNKNLDIMEEKTAIRPYYSIGMMEGMSVGPHDNCMIIE